MADLVVPLPTNLLPRGYTFAASVARWLEANFADGSLRYRADPKGPHDYWCSPAVTRLFGRGDCDDLAILTAAFLQAGGVHARVTTGLLVSHAERAGHAWVEGCDEHGAFLIEATSGKLVRTVRPSEYVPFIWLDRTSYELAA